MGRAWSRKRERCASPPALGPRAKAGCGVPALSGIEKAALAAVRDASVFLSP